MSRWKILARAFSTTVLKISSEVRHIKAHYWVAMVGVAAAGDLVVLIVSSL